MSYTRNRYREQLLPALGDPLDVLARLVANLDDRDYVCFEGADGWSVGVGRAAEVVADRAYIVMRGPDGQAKLPWDRQSIRSVPRLLADVGIQGWRAYGWSGFDLAAAKEGRLDLVGEDRFLHLVIPEIEVRMGPAGTLVRALHAADLEWVRRRLAVRDGPTGRRHPVDGVASDLVGDIEQGRQEYEAAVDNAVNAIELGRLRKVVLARKIAVSSAVDLTQTLVAGRRVTSPPRSFLFALDGLEAAGLSPESVVHVSSTGVVTSQLLAGTRAQTGSPRSEAAVRDELLSDPKEVFEHAISVRAALDEMSTVCDPSSVLVKDLLSVKPSGSLRHLASTVRGRLADGRNGWDAFCAMFPAVTLTGTPKLAACELIHELEKVGRGAYGGAVLTYEPSGVLDTAAVLRTIFRSGGRTWLHAGAGVVRQSRPEREFTETCEKALAIARYVVPREPAGMAEEIQR